MQVHKFVQANPDEVAAKVVQGEAIIINLASGVYYSMTGVGAAAWGLLEATGDVERTVDTLCASYNVDAPRCRAEVERLVAELLTERLLLPGDQPDGPRPGSGGDAAAPDLGGARPQHLP